MIFDHAVDNCSLCLETSCTHGNSSVIKIRVLKTLPHPKQFTHFFMMSYNTDFVEARADDIFDGWVTQFFRDLTPTDESALYSLALDKAIEEAN